MKQETKCKSKWTCRGILVINSSLCSLKVTQNNYVSRKELHSKEFLLSPFEFERQNIAGWCKQTFCFQFSSKAKHDFFSFLSGLLNGHKNSYFFKTAVEWHYSMKWNYGGFTFNWVTISHLQVSNSIATRLFWWRLQDILTQCWPCLTRGPSQKLNSKILWILVWWHCHFILFMMVTCLMFENEF